jgi:broad specificity phosphatase PhoE
VIWLVRHGETEFNREHRLQGRMDSALTELGLSQAARVGRWFASRVSDPDRWTISASPLGRARRTAAIIAEHAGLAGRAAVDERLAELSIGSWEGKTRAELETLRPDLAGKYFFMRSPDGETWADASGRIGAWLADWAEWDDHDVIAVSHAGAGKVLRALYLGLSVEEARELDVPQDAVFRLHGGQAERFDCAALPLDASAS